MVDTNSDPRNIDFPIPANDDASKSISLIIGFITESIAEGLGERKLEKDKDDKEAKETKQPKEAKDTKGKRERVKDSKIEMKPVVKSAAILDESEEEEED